MNRKRGLMIDEGEIRADDQRVLDFWFGTPGARGYGAERKEWFVKKPAFDAQIRARFQALHARAHAGACAAWRDNPSSLLALIIVLDQFSRNMYRDTPAAFASDPAALAAARLMIANGWDARLMPAARHFVYLPFEHSEDLAAQEESMRLFAAAAVDPDKDEGVDWARKHHDIIRRFGRFPHRNAILGRPSTPEELAFLKQPGSRF